MCVVTAASTVVVKTQYRKWVWRGLCMRYLWGVAQAYSSTEQVCTYSAPFAKLVNRDNLSWWGIARKWSIYIPVVWRDGCLTGGKRFELNVPLAAGFALPRCHFLVVGTMERQSLIAEAVALRHHNLWV